MSFPKHTFYSTAQLLKIYKQLAYPSAGKLHNLLKKAGTEEFSSKELKQLEDIIARCEPCQRIRNAHLRFRVTMGHGYLRVNAKEDIDTKYLDG